MSIFNNKYKLTAKSIQDTLLVVEMINKDNLDAPSHIVEIPILLFSPANNENFLLVIDRIEGSQVIVEISEKNNPDALAQTIEFPINFFDIEPTEGMKYTNKIEEIQNLSDLDVINQNLHHMFSSSFSMSNQIEDKDILREAEERLERLKQSSPTDEIIDL